MQAPASFTVKFDLTGTPKIVLTDNSGWTVGEKPDVTGYFEITLPDGIKRSLDLSTADVSYSGSDLTPFEYNLRLDSAGLPQRGTYIIRYVTDHPSYTPGEFIRTFEWNYSSAELDLEEDFDVFTPSLFYRDLTNYTKSGYTTTTLTRAWEAVIGTVGTVTGSSANFDLAYGGDYYDAEYDISLQVDILYTHTTNSWLTVLDRITEEIDTTADTPPTVNDILQCIKDLKDLLDAAAGNCTVTDSLEAKYQKAMTRYDNLIHNLRLGDTEGAEDLLEEIINLTSCTHSVNRNQIINPYDLSAYTGGSGSYTPPYYYTIPADATEVTLSAMNGKTIHEISLDGIGRLFSNGADGDTPGTGEFIVVTGSAPRKFKFGGTLMKDQWLKIVYT